jgi:hypothetical protein
VSELPLPPPGWIAELLLFSMISGLVGVVVLGVLILILAKAKPP